MDEQRLGGAVENAIHKFADHAADDLMFRARGAIDESAILPALFQVALSFENFHHGHNGGVGDFSVLEQGFVDIANGGIFALPDELHDFEFLRSEGGVFWPHGRDTYSTNEFVCQGENANQAIGVPGTATAARRAAWG